MKCNRCKKLLPYNGIKIDIINRDTNIKEKTVFFCSDCFDDFSKWRNSVILRKHHCCAFHLMHYKLCWNVRGYAFDHEQLELFEKRILHNAREAMKQQNQLLNEYNCKNCHDLPNNQLVEYLNLENKRYSNLYKIGYRENSICDDCMQEFNERYDS